MRRPRSEPTPPDVKVKLLAKGKKRCPRCDTVKRVDEFTKHSSKPDGLQCVCKACQYGARDATYQAQRRERALQRRKEKALAVQTTRAK